MSTPRSEYPETQANAALLERWLVVSKEGDALNEAIHKLDLTAVSTGVYGRVAPERYAGCIEKIEAHYRKCMAKAKVFQR